MIKHGPVVQLAILSIHVLTSGGQTLTETPTDQAPFSGQALVDVITSVLEQQRFSLDCIQSIRDSRVVNTSVSAWCSLSYNRSYLLCPKDELESVSKYLCQKYHNTGDYTSSVDKESISTHGHTLSQRNNLRASLLENTRNNDIIYSIITYISNRCKKHMTAGLQNLIAPQGCTFLESIKPRLLEHVICTIKEYDIIHVAVCDEANNTRYLFKEKSLRNTALGEIQNEVSNFCYSSLFPNGVEVDVSENLNMGCKRLQSVGRNLVTRTICSQQEIDTLTSELCFPAVERVSNEQRRRDEISDVVQNDVTESCREAMLSRKTNMRGKSVDEACQILRVFREILLNTEFCTPGDYAKLEVVTCGRGHRETLSIFMTLLCLLLALTR